MTGIPFVDFDVHIFAVDGEFHLQVTQSPVGASKAAAFRWPFKERIDVVHLRVEHALLKIQMRGMRSGPMSANEQVLRDFGASMFNAVFRDDPEISRRFNGSIDLVEAQRQNVAGLRLKLTIDPPELSALPWEYLFDDSGKDVLQSYLCLRSRSPLVRYLPLGSLQDSGRLKPPLKILGMIADPGASFPGGDWEKLEGVPAERSGIDQAMSRVSDPSKIKFQWVCGQTPDDLDYALRQDDWHVFHFIGHGVVEEYQDSDGTQRSEPYLVLSDGLGGVVKVSVSQLALRLERLGRLRLVVLNCCEIGRHAGVVLMHCGLPSVVAMQFKITDAAAVRFASAFYSSLLAGMCVEQALSEARVSMQLHCGMEWATPVHITRSGSDILFDADDAVSPRPPIAPSGAMGALEGSLPLNRPALLAPEPTSPSQEVAAAVMTASAQRRLQAQNELRRIFSGVGH